MVTKQQHFPCEGSGYYAKDITEGFAICPYCNERRSVRSDGSIRSHRGKKVYLPPNVVREPVVDPVVIDLQPEVPPPVEESPGKDRPSYIISLVGGVAIGWDSCGRCLMHIRTCECKEPTRPSYIDKLIAAEDKEKSY